MGKLSDLKAMAVIEKDNEKYEYRDWFLYDAMLSAANQTQTIRFFQQNGGTVGRALTNMTGNGQLPSGEVFFITEFVFSIYNASGLPFEHVIAAAGANPLNLITGSMFWDFRVEPSVEFQGHGRLLKDQVNIGIDTLTSGTSSIPLEAKVLKMRTPITLFPNRSFSLDMTVTTPAAANGYVAADTLFFWGLRGIKRRAK